MIHIIYEEIKPEFNLSFKFKLPMMALGRDDVKIIVEADIPTQVDPVPYKLEYDIWASIADGLTRYFILSDDILVIDSSEFPNTVNKIIEKLNETEAFLPMISKYIPNNV